ncbi:hypothetical protein KI387_007427 [Taxus chinensis]|uniref:Uncharacterized protein n=1 Tax=Taxus chinensis TaxID=29808 RepID=A0AA38GPJ5_TAXCH|nr:hypothetical protein KI387_007427 [Taxus chinensis]
MAAPMKKRQNAMAKTPPPQPKSSFLEPDVKWVRTQWPQLPHHSSAKINLINAGLDKYLQTPLLPLDLNLLKHSVTFFDGNGIPFGQKGYVRIDPQTVSAVTGLPTCGDSVDMSVWRKRANSPGGRARVALEICGSDKAFGSKGIRVDLIKPVELRWAAAVLASRVFGQQKGEYLNLGHFNLVKMVSLGHKFNWAEFVASRIKEKLRKIQCDGKGCFYMGTVLTGLIYDQVPHLGPKGAIALVGEGPSLMKWAALCPKKERGCFSTVKHEAMEGPGFDGELEPCDDEKEEGGPLSSFAGPMEVNEEGGALGMNGNAKEEGGAVGIHGNAKDKGGLPSSFPRAVGMNGHALGTCALDMPNSRNGRLHFPPIGYNKPLVLTATPLRENGTIAGPENISFSQLLQKQVLLSTSGSNAADVGRILGCSQDLGNTRNSLCLDVADQKSESQPFGHNDEPSAMLEACSVSGTGSPCNQESPKPKSSEVAEQLESPIRKHTLFERNEDISSKRRKLLECRSSETLLRLPLQQMTVGENLMLFKSVFDEVDKRLQIANQECESWKSCARGLCKDLNQHFAGLPIKELYWPEILNKESMDSAEMQQSRAYIKKAAKIIKEQDTEIQLFKLKEEKIKSLESAKLALEKDLEMEQQYRKSAEVRAVDLERQLLQFKVREEIIKKLESANWALKKDLEMEQQYKKSAEAQAAHLEGQLVQFKKKLHRVLED